MAADLDIEDIRVAFVADYALKTMKLKGDKWTKMYSIEENSVILAEFFEKPETTTLILYLNPAGLLVVSTEWPTNLKQKACYFVKRGKDAIPKDASVRNALLYGDISASPIDQLAAFVDQVACLWVWRAI